MVKITNFAVSCQWRCFRVSVFDDSRD